MLSKFGKRSVSTSAAMRASCQLRKSTSAFAARAASCDFRGDVDRIHALTPIHACDPHSLARAHFCWILTAGNFNFEEPLEQRLAGVRHQSDQPVDRIHTTLIYSDGAVQNKVKRS